MGQPLTFVVRSSQPCLIGEAEYLKTAKSAEVAPVRFTARLRILPFPLQLPGRLRCRQRVKVRNRF
jgi:hypothetical protein